MAAFYTFQPMYHRMQIALKKLDWSHTETDFGEVWETPDQEAKITFDKGESPEEKKTRLTATLQDKYNIGKEVIDHLLANLHFYSSKDYILNLLSARFGFFFTGSYCHLTEVMAFMNLLPVDEKNIRVEFLVWLNVFGSRVLMKRSSFLVTIQAATSFRWFGGNSLYDWAKGKLLSDITNHADSEMERDQPKWKQGYAQLYSRSFHLGVCNNEIFRALLSHKDFAGFTLRNSTNQALKDIVKLIDQVIITEEPSEDKPDTNW